MFGIISSAIFSALGWIFQTAIIKFVVFGALFLVVTEFVDWLLPMMPSFGGIFSAASGQASGVGWFLSFFKIDVGINMVLSAYGTRFMIRRIPVIG